MKQGFKYVIIIWLLTLPVLVCTVRIRTRIIGSNRCDFIKVESLTLGENGSTTLSCLDCNVAGGRGAVSCACTGGSIGVEIPVIGGGISGGGASCEVTVGNGYFACCYKDSNGLCRCPSCPN